MFSARRSRGRAPTAPAGAPAPAGRGVPAGRRTTSPDTAVYAWDAGVPGAATATAPQDYPTAAVGDLFGKFSKGLRQLFSTDTRPGYLDGLEVDTKPGYPPQVYALLDGDKAAAFQTIYDTPDVINALDEFEHVTRQDGVLTPSVDTYIRLYCATVAADLFVHTRSEIDEKTEGLHRAFADPDEVDRFPQELDWMRRGESKKIKYRRDFFEARRRGSYVVANSDIPQRLVIRLLKETADIFARGQNPLKAKAVLILDIFFAVAPHFRADFLNAVYDDIANVKIDFNDTYKNVRNEVMTTIKDVLEDDNPNAISKIPALLLLYALAMHAASTGTRANRVSVVLTMTDLMFPKTDIGRLVGSYTKKMGQKVRPGPWAMIARAGTSLLERWAATVGSSAEGPKEIRGYISREVVMNHAGRVAHQYVAQSRMAPLVKAAGDLTTALETAGTAGWMAALSNNIVLRVGWYMDLVAVGRRVGHEQFPGWKVFTAYRLEIDESIERKSHKSWRAEYEQDYSEERALRGSNYDKNRVDSFADQDAHVLSTYIDALRRRIDHLDAAAIRFHDKRETMNQAASRHDDRPRIIREGGVYWEWDMATIYFASRDMDTYTYGHNLDTYESDMQNIAGLETFMRELEEALGVKVAAEETKKKLAMIAQEEKDGMERQRVAEEETERLMEGVAADIREAEQKRLTVAREAREAAVAQRKQALLDELQTTTAATDVLQKNIEKTLVTMEIHNTARDLRDLSGQLTLAKMKVDVYDQQLFQKQKYMDTLNAMTNPGTAAMTLTREAIVELTALTDKVALNKEIWGKLQKMYEDMTTRMTSRAGEYDIRLDEITVTIPVKQASLVAPPPAMGKPADPPSDPLTAVRAYLQLDPTTGTEDLGDGPAASVEFLDGLYKKLSDDLEAMLKMAEGPDMDVLQAAIDPASAAQETARDLIARLEGALSRSNDDAGAGSSNDDTGSDDDDDAGAGASETQEAVLESLSAFAKTNIELANLLRDVVDTPPIPQTEF
jgi:hypothetical protein